MQNQGFPQQPQYPQAPQYDPRFDPQDIENTKYMNILAYISLLFLIPMFVNKDSKFTKFHVNQGIVLCIFSVAGTIVFSILGTIVAFIPFVGWMIGLVISLISLVYSIVIFVFMILGIINTCTGKAKELPLIGKITIYK